MNYRIVAAVALLVSLFSWPALLPAQTTNATITGFVTDPTKSLIVGAKVDVSNMDTNIHYTATSNQEGSYTVPNLPPGTYRIEVEKPGFKTIVKSDLVLHVQDTAAINFQMGLGSASEIVTVQAGGLVVNTTDASVSTVIDNNFVESLPLNGRSFNTLLQLTPGVIIAPSNTGAFNQGQFNINGQRADANSFTVDGVSVNFGVGVGQNLALSGTGGAQAMSALGGTSSLVSVDALQEFRIETSSYAPEFGTMPGGQVIMTTRSGTDEFHGAAFDYFRNTVMDANDWFSKRADLARSPEHHNDFGGVFGGPVWKDKTFFFFSYEGARLDSPLTSTITVPSEYARTVASAAIAPYLNAYPLPADMTITPGVYLEPLTAGYANRATLNATSLRIDHVFNDRFSIYARYNYAPSKIVGPAQGFSLSTFQTNMVNTQTMTLGGSMVLSPRVLNTFRLNYSMQSNSLSYKLDSFGGATPLNPSLLLGSGPNSSQNLALFYDLDASYLAVGSEGLDRTRQADAADDMSISVGSHQLKFGGEFKALFLDAKTDPNYLLYELLSTQDFATGASAGVVPYFIPYVFVPSQFLTNEFSLYGQDTWKVTSRLNLTYGLRWELDPAPIGLGGTTLSAFRNVNNPATINFAAPGTPLWATTYHNLAPRVGVAYRLTPQGDFVLRAGVGIFYDTGVGNTANLAFAFPNSTSSFFSNVQLPIANLQSYIPTISLQAPYSGSFQGSVPDLQLPRSYQWNLALEKSFGDKQAVSVTYVGQAGRDLVRTEAFPISNPDFGAGAYLYLTSNDSRSNYNALQVQYRRPLASRLQALLNYSWSHSLDNASNDYEIEISHTIVSGASQYDSSDFDVRQSFSGALSYDLPAAGKSGPIAALTKGWSVDTVIVARTGFPFNAVIFAPSSLAAGARIPPNLVPDQPFWIAKAGAPGGKILNANAFSVPPTPVPGTERRNDIAGFGFTQVDLSIARKFPITERLGLQFRADAFNLFNHPNFANPPGYIQYGPLQYQSNAMLNAVLGEGGLNPLFQEGGPRSLQLSLRLAF
jgi:Carboxypeptidase regulatory-like domain/TonB dependent receptor/TonB-dependent Receptor Plug Domain